MAVPSKAAQEAESRARAEAGVEPALNAGAVEGSEIDGSPGDPGGQRPARQPGTEEPPRPSPVVKSSFDTKRADIISRFRTKRDEDKANEQTDEISDFTRAGAPPEVLDESATAPAEGEVEDEGEAPEPVVAAEAPKTVKLKVHGREVEMTLEDALNKAQIALASENILDDAKAKHKELEALLLDARTKVARVDRPAQHQDRQPNTPQPTDEQPDPADPEHHEDPIAKLVETLQFGDPNEAGTQLRNTIASHVSQGVEQALSSQRLKDEGARAAKVLIDFEGQHPEIAKDKKARAAIESDVLDLQVEDITALGVNLNQIRPDGFDPTPGDIALAHRWYRAQGFTVRSPETMLETATKNFLDWKGIKSPNPADPPPPPATTEKTAPRVEVTVDRTARRQAIQQQPSQSGAKPRTPAQAQPPAPRDRSSIVQDMVARRNQPRGRIVA